ncbi:UDP-N-acetylmuramoylalanine--D-glutamate ligase [Spirochaetia bacterium]|nr:UDP-N-acetylmuramoylalanine--D-glutamate ligase [Spirochaetia bacterium]
MGLGLHGGGLESARYLALQGAEVTVTDLRDEKTLAPSIEKLSALNGKISFPIRYVLGRHETEDFEKTDMVIKNPGVRRDSPFLQASIRCGRRIETDISLFLAASPARLLAVTGSKGKSGTASSLHFVLQNARKQGVLRGKACLGGNITVSPLTFLEDLRPEDDVVLELSSWQLGDLAGRRILKPRAAVLTAIMSDHQDYYGNMESYVADKRIIYQNQDHDDITVSAIDDEWGRSFSRETPGRSLVYSEKPLPEHIAGGWLTGPSGPGLGRRENSSEIFELVPPELLMPGFHQKKNCLAAALALWDLGLDAAFIRESLGRFPGIEHRLEFFHEAGGVKFYNDTAATIPEAAAAAVEAFEKPLILVTGGTDKNLDFSPLVKAAAKTKALVLLAGTGSDKLKPLLAGANIPFQGPFDTVEAAVKAACNAADKGDIVLLSPGCASFGMFQNEFDRGRKWKEAVVNA